MVTIYSPKCICFFFGGGGEETDVSNQSLRLCLRRIYMTIDLKLNWATHKVKQ